MGNIEYDLSRFEVQDKVVHEYQAICLELVAEFPKTSTALIWGLPRKYHYKKVGLALEKYKKGKVKTFAYYMGILKNT